MEKLTDREIAVLKYITQGLENREIGLKMFISTHTVKAHICSIMKKLKAKNRTNAVFIACKNNIICL